MQAVALGDLAVDLVSRIGAMLPEGAVEVAQGILRNLTIDEAAGPPCNEGDQAKGADDREDEGVGAGEVHAAAALC